MATKREVQLHQARLQGAEQQLVGRRSVIAGLAASSKTLADQARLDVQAQLDRNITDLARIDDMTTSTLLAPWELESWGRWHPNDVALPVWLRVGGYRETRSSSRLPVPATVAFLGGGQPLAIVCSDINATQAAQVGESLLSSMLLRISAALTGRVRVVSADPSWSDAVAATTADLDEIVKEILRRTRLFIDENHPDLEAVPLDRRTGEQYIVVAVPGFPNRYDERTRRSLTTIARTGSSVGVYLIAHADRPRDVSHWPCAIVDIGQQSQLLSGLPVSIEFDSVPGSPVLDLVLDRIRSAVPVARSADWDPIVGVARDSWWEESADERLLVPIGTDDAHAALALWFGADSVAGRTAVHGVVSSMPGAGRSNLFHSLIAGLAVRYSPEELNFCLIDGPNGADFLPYRHLPHAAIVSARTAPDFAESVVGELVDELDRRTSLFEACEVSDFTGYRRRGQPSGVLPRVLAIIDDLDELLALDNPLLLRLVRDGRAGGIHLLVGVNRMSGSPDFFANLHLRVVLQLAQSEVATLTEFGPAGRRLIAQHCDRAGRAVVNHVGGDDAANAAGRLAFLGSTRRDSLVRELASRAQQRPGLHLPDQLVNDGAVAPRLLDNPWVNELLATGWPAVTPFTANDPISGWIGREVGPRGHTRLDLHRSAAENVAFVGAAENDRLSMVASFLLTAALGASSERLHVWIGDASPASSVAATTLPYVAAGLSMAGYQTKLARGQSDLGRLVREAIAELDHRIGLDDAAREREPTLIVALNEPDRAVALQRIPDEYGMVDSPLSLGLRRLLIQGPRLGIHVLFSTPSVPLLHSIVADRAVQQLIRARVALHMADDDSYAFIRSARATELLGRNGQSNRAVAFDALNSTSSLFVAYSLSGTPPLLDEFDKILSALRTWSAGQAFVEP